MSIYEELGVRPLINASATLTRLGGSVMPPEVVQRLQAETAKAVAAPDIRERFSGLGVEPRARVRLRLGGADAAQQLHHLGRPSHRERAHAVDHREDGLTPRRDADPLGTDRDREREPRSRETPWSVDDDRIVDGRACLLKLDRIAETA